MTTKRNPTLLPESATFASDGSLAVQPYLPQDPNSVWGRIDIERDRLFGCLRRLLDARLPAALLVRSNPGVYPVEITVEAWFGGLGQTERVRSVIELVPKPNHRYPIEYVVHLVNRGRKEKIWRLPALDDASLERLVDSIRLDESWSDKQRRLRDWPYQIFLRRNHVTGVLPDFLGRARLAVGVALLVAAVTSSSGQWVVEMISETRLFLRDGLFSILSLFPDAQTQYILGIVGVVAAAIAWLGMPAGRLRKTVFAAAAVVCFATQPGEAIIRLLGGSPEFVSQAEERSEEDAQSATHMVSADSAPGVNSNIMAMAVLAAWLALRFFDRRRTTIVFNDGRPQINPRRLRVADYWNTVVEGLGDQVEVARERLIATLRPAAQRDFLVETERIIALGPDGKEEREQIVLTFRRAIMFCHLYAYGSNVYVGWDAHLNLGQWSEVEVARGSKGLKYVVSMRSVTPSWQAVSEYDVHDLNYLIEWAHNALSSVVKQLVAEQQVDQEIDFSIQRVQRNTLLEPAVEKKRRSLADRFKRLS